MAVIVIDEATVTKYGKRNGQVREAVRVWFAKVQYCTWNNHHDVLANFSSADFIGKGRYIFDIKGNHYRLVAKVLFALRTVDIRRIMTHAEFSKLSHQQLLAL